MRKNKKFNWVPLTLIFIGLILVGGAIGWLAFTAYQNNQRSQESSVFQTSTQTGARIPYPEIQRVSIKDAKAAYEIGNAIFLDVRGEQYFQQARIPGALSIPEEQLPQRLNELQKSEWIIPYCT
jgi:3-mercaptopyruvate sulfurtransferase SseA